MITFKIVPTPDAIDPLTGCHTGEHDLVSLTDAGLFGEWYGTFGSKREALTELADIRRHKEWYD